MSPSDPASRIATPDLPTPYSAIIVAGVLQLGIFLARGTIRPLCMFVLLSGYFWQVGRSREFQADWPAHGNCRPYRDTGAGCSQVCPQCTLGGRFRAGGS